MENFFRIKQYFKYRYKSQGIMFMHSPFVYNLEKKAIYNKTIHKDKNILQLRKSFNKDRRCINITDFGAGALKYGHKYKTTISHITKNSSKSWKYEKLILNLIDYFKPEKIIELGTSFGFTSASIAKHAPNTFITTIEGSPEIYEIAIDNFKKLKITNVKAILSEFDNIIESISSKNIDMILFDGNHTKEATIRYFNHFLKYKSEKSIFIFDDINWSKDMNQAWDYIKKHDQVTLALDLFELGIVFFKSEIKEKRTFTIKY